MKQLVLLAFFLPIFLLGQNFTDEDYVYLNRHDKISIQLSNGDFKISKEVSEHAKFLTANKLYFANDIIHFDSFSEIKDIEAYTVIADSNKKVKVDYIETKREFDNGIFYSDQQSKNFTFPAVNKGAETFLNYTIDIKDPHFMDLFRFGTYAPTKHAKLSVEFPENVTLGYITFNTDNVNITLDKKTSENKNIYTWTAEQVSKYQGEENSEDHLY
ncbi:MAG: DUF3857 domain-containing protein, partial [Bacteroidia bacterium]|nr:DUF3857 domain-containing protein [Bacteroidia bacterium]